MATGFLTVYTPNTVSLQATGVLKCIWTWGGRERIGDDCTFDGAGLFTAYAPTLENVPANTDIRMMITTMYADNCVEGFIWGDVLERYVLDIEIFPSGIAINKERRYIQMVPDTIVEMWFIIDHYS